MAAQTETKEKTVKKASRLQRLPKPSKTTMFIVIWIFFLLVVGFTVFNTARNNALAADKAALSVLEAVKDNDDLAVYNLGTDDFKKASSQKKVKAVVNEWSKVIAQATNGTPELVSKQAVMKDNQEYTTLVYKYTIQPGKSKINQKELFVRVVLQKTNSGYKIYTFNIDTKKNDSK